jgi:hypothetical protein
MIELFGGLVGELNLEEPLEPCEKIIILLFFLFFTNFESPKIDLSIKSYAN